MVSNMEFIGPNCTDCPHSLLHDFCKAFAENLFIECELLHGHSVKCKLGV